MKNRIRLFIVLLVVVMVAAACGGGGQSPAAGTSAPAQSADAAKTAATGGAAEPAKSDLDRALLKFVFGGPGYSAQEDVWKNVSQVAGDRLNADFQITFYPWGDEYVQKLQLQISSGDDFDLNFDGDWMAYNTLVNKGAYLDLKDLAPVYMPEYYKYMEETGMLKSTFVGDGMYCVPWTPLFNPRPWFTWDDEWIENTVEWDESTISTMEDVDAFLQKAKELNPTSEHHLFEAVGDYDVVSMLQPKYNLCKWDFHYLTYDLTDPTAKLIPEEQTELFREAGMWAKKWVDEGIFPRDAYTNKTAHDTLGRTHKYSGHAMYEYIVANDDYLKPNKHYALLYPDGYFANKNPVNNLNAINKNAKNPERTLMFLDLLWTDQEFYNAVLYGIEGVTYIKDEATGQLLFPEGMDNTTTNWMEWNSQWGFWRIGHMQPTAMRTAESWKLNDEFMAKPQNVVAQLAGFVPNTDAIKNEIATRDALYIEFGALIEYGLVDDLDAAIEQYIQKQKDAGLDKILEHIQTQVDEFLAS